jgi:molybdenum cofactor guanylyltransferase
MSKTAFDALILAGGKSSRMGRDKALIDFEGCPLLLRQLETARKAGAQEIYVSARSEADYRSFPVSVLADDYPGCGPISGLIAGLRRVSSPLLLVLAVDLPFVSPDLLRRLFGLCRPGQGAVPLSRGFYEPLAAFYPPLMLPHFEQARERAEFGLQPVIAKGVERGFLRAYELKEEEKVLFQNWNTPSLLPPKE